MPYPLNNQRFTGLRPEIGLTFLVWALLSVAAGFRWLGVGKDYGEYIYFYSQLGTFETVFHSRFEPGFVLIAWVFKQLGAPYGLFSFFLVALSLAIKFSLIHKYTKWPLVAIFCYISLFYFLHEYTQIRAGVALAFGLLASFAYCENRFFRSAILLLIAATFQSSILALGLGFAIYSSTKSPKYLVFYLVIFFTLLFLLQKVSIIEMASMLNPLILAYINEASDFDPPNKYSPANILLLMSIMFSLSLAIKDRILGHRMSLIMCILALVTFFAFYSFPLMANRMFGLYSIFVIFLSFNFRGFGLPSIAGVATVLNAFWALRNAIGQQLIG